ncbi:hypothetical protein C8J56DRAFT_839609, partial [Mycena floridula]
MKFSSVLAALTSLAVVSATPAARALSCAEASRYGDLTVTPTDLTPGASFTIHNDLACAIENFGHVPKSLDYSLVVPPNVNNGFESSIVIARRTFDATSGATVDTFTAQIPFYAGYFKGAAYNIELTLTYPQKATVAGEPDVLLQGGVFSPINLTIS